MAVNSNVKATKKGGILNFIRGIKSEIRIISWPSKKNTKKALIAVAIVSLIYIVYVGGLDYIFQNLFEVILKLK
ncbi:preprotein translocase subunit SecE [Clostridium paraputrificum]|uniref:preprotein translocase subunit SecE n=1 Tax=Clostridium TaxID=1485 RepID=UPI003D352B46